ncbi:hypothetical protein ACHAXA_004303 [Cyclostephanos tholiformis]|uniref:Uncharacterized protein n=1 Tax=Cyclostephanos tholiformis TaxID=382380 RepID=A0ABD3SGB6_9STRA
MARRHGPRVIARLICLCLPKATSLLLPPRSANSLAFVPVPPTPPPAAAARPVLTNSAHSPARTRRILSSSTRRRRPRIVVCESYSSATILRGTDDRLRDEIERSAQRRAYEDRSRGGGTGEAVGGAILGGLLGGPFGALFGAQIGASFGAASSLDRAREEEMRRRGLTPDMLRQATEIGTALRQAVEGLSAIRESVETSRRLARDLDRREKSLYERAMSAISSGDEEVARRLLLERESVKGKLLKILTSISEDRKRIAIMEGNVEALEIRGVEIENLLRRSVGAASLQDSSNVGFGLSLEPEDPLLKKFRDLGMS